MSGKCSILLITEQLEQQKSLESTLFSLGMCCTLAASVSQSLELTEKNHYELLIVSATVFDIGGFELVDNIRNNKINHRSPVLFLLTDDVVNDHFMTRALSSPLTDFLVYPCNPDIFLGKVRLLLSFVQRLEEIQLENTELETNVEQMRNYVGIVAHDLRAPLGKLINLSEVLVAGVDTEELPTFYKLMQKTSRRAFDLVTDILDMAAVENGRFKLDITRCDLWPLVIQAFSELNYLADQKDIRMVNEIEDSIEVRADGRRIFQVLTNLLTNAIKFTPKYGTINMLAIPSNDGITIEVRDTGVGIPAEMLPLLFFKHQKTTTRGTEGERGTGFGLPLSQQLLKAHGSQIQVQTELGRGSIFSFFLPYFRD